MTELQVPAGTYSAVHVRLASGQPSGQVTSRDTWFAPGVGVVREQVVDGSTERVLELEAFLPGRPARRERLLRQLEEHLAAGHLPAFNNTPWIGWIEDGPEALLLPGRVAVVKAERWARCYYVDDDEARSFAIDMGYQLAGALRAAFGTKRTEVPEHVSLAALTLLAARAEAERLHLAKVRTVEPTLPPPKALPRGDGRRAHVEVEGGAPDGTMRRLALWITVGEQGGVRFATDADDPWPKLK